MANPFLLIKPPEPIPQEFRVLVPENFRGVLVDSSRQTVRWPSSGSAKTLLVRNWTSSPFLKSAKTESNFLIFSSSTCGSSIAGVKPPAST